MEIEQYLITFLIAILSLFMVGIAGMFTFGLLSKMYSNIRQMLLEKESSEKVQKD